MKNLMTKRNLFIALVVPIIILDGAIVIQKNMAPQIPPVIVNPGFEPDEDGDLLNGWENQALFAYDDRALPAMYLFNQP